MRQYPLAIVLFSVLASAPIALSRPAQAQPRPATADVKAPAAETPPPDESDSERRKRLARLGSGQVRYQAPIGEVHSLEAMVERVMEVNPQVVARQYTRLYATLRQDEANWWWFPEFEVGGKLTYVPHETDFNEVGSNLSQYVNLDIGPLVQGSLRIVFPITTFGKVDTLQELAALGIDQADIEERKLRLELIRKVREAYLSVQLGKLLEALSADGNTLIKEEIARLDEAREFGDEAVDIEELRKLQIYEAELDTKTIDTERLIRLTRAALTVLAQLKSAPWDVTPFDEDLDTNTLPPLSQCLEIARQNRPDIVLLDKAVAARKLQVDLAVTKFYPDIFFAVDLGTSYSTVEAPNQTGLVASEPGEAPIPFELEPLTDPFNYNRLAFALGLRLKVNPVNQYWKVQQARAQLSETEGLQAAAHEGIDLDVEKQWVEANDHRRKVEVLDRRLKAAERWRNQISVAYQSGGAEFQDFIAPLKAYYEARVLLIKSKYDYLIALAWLAEKMGVTDIENIAIEARGGE